MEEFGWPSGTLEEFTRERYLPFIKGYKKSWPADDSYLRHHILPVLGKRHLDVISQQEVIELHHGMRDRGYALASANRVVILLRYMYNLAKKWKIPGAENNPTGAVQLYEPNNSRERFLSAAETLRLKEAIERSVNPQLQYIVALCLLCGNRKRELLDSRWGDFDLERRNWRIPMSKSGKFRHVPLSAMAVSVLQQIPRIEGCDYVVANPKTKKPYVSIFCSWNTARKQAGLPDVRMHDLRHSFASNLVNSGRSIYEVARALGHSQIKTSSRYSHLSQDTLLAAVDAAANATGTNWAPTLPAQAGDNLAAVAAG